MSGTQILFPVPRLSNRTENTSAEENEYVTKLCTTPNSTNKPAVKVTGEGLGEGEEWEERGGKERGARMESGRICQSWVFDKGCPNTWLGDNWNSCLRHIAYNHQQKNRLCRSSCRLYSSWSIIPGWQLSGRKNSRGERTTNNQGLEHLQRGEVNVKENSWDQHESSSKQTCVTVSNYLPHTSQLPASQFSITCAFKLLGGEGGG